MYNISCYSLSRGFGNLSCRCIIFLAVGYVATLYFVCVHVFSVLLCLIVICILLLLRFALPSLCAVVPSVLYCSFGLFRPDASWIVLVHCRFFCVPLFIFYFILHAALTVASSSFTPHLFGGFMLMSCLFLHLFTYLVFTLLPLFFTSSVLAQFVCLYFPSRIGCKICLLI